jgi:uncharacterized protein (TIGR02145 family)
MNQIQITKVYRFVQTIFIGIILLGIYQPISAQSIRLKATQYGGKFVYKGDTVELMLVTGRGELQWQKSIDQISWEDIPGANQLNIFAVIDTTQYFRVNMTEENCDPAFSEVISVVPMLINENAILLDSTDLVIRSDSAELSQGLYRLSTSQDVEINLGEVIVGQQGNGFIRRVADVQKNGDEWYLTTTQGTLEDVIDEMVLNDSLVIVVNGPEPKTAKVNGQDVPIEIIHQAPGVAFKSGGGISLSNTVLVDKQVGDAQIHAMIDAGSISFNPTFRREMNISLFQGLKYLELSAGGEVTMSCGLVVSASNDFNFNPDPINLLKFKIGPIMLGPVPMIITMGFDVGCALGFNAEGRFETGYDAAYGVEFGARYNKYSSPKWSPIWERGGAFTEHPPELEIAGGLHTRVFVIPYIEVEIADVAGPYLEVEPYLRGDVNVNLPNWNYELAAGIDSKIGFKVEVFGWELANFDYDLLSKEWMIASGSGSNPSVLTMDAEDVTSTSAKIWGSIVNSGGTPIIGRGFCWDDSPDPNFLDNTEELGTGIGGFHTTLTSLNNNSTYYYRAFAFNATGVSWGEQKTFYTQDQYQRPTVTSSPISNITETTADAGGNVLDDGGTSVTSKGVCWNTIGSPTISDTKTSDGTGTGSFSSSITGLTQNTTYYVRAYATNSEGTSYGTQREFTSDQSAGLPTVTTTDISSITETTANGGGNVTHDGGASVTSRGVCWNTTGSPSISDNKTSDGTGTGSFASSLSGLNQNITYYVRAYATNNEGTAYGQQKQFTTGGGMTLPTVETTVIYDVTETSAMGTGNVTDDGGANVTERGMCISLSQNPTIANDIFPSGTDLGYFTCTINGLSADTKYYVRAYATNSQGTAYGSQIEFTTEGGSGGSGSFTDSRDSKTYDYVTIGSQTWMAENLNFSIASGSWCYDDSNTNCSTYGRLYKWDVAQSACPSGWHLPSDGEWMVLEEYLGMSSSDANNTGLRSTGDVGLGLKSTSGWSSNGNGNNSDGFDALPAGSQNYTGNSDHLGEKAFFWTSTPSGSLAFDRRLAYNENGVYRYGNNRNNGLSVRCIKD